MFSGSKNKGCINMSYNEVTRQFCKLVDDRKACQYHLNDMWKCKQEFFHLDGILKYKYLDTTCYHISWTAWQRESALDFFRWTCAFSQRSSKLRQVFNGSTKVGDIRWTEKTEVWNAKHNLPLSHLPQIQSKFSIVLKRN